MDNRWQWPELLLYVQRRREEIPTTVGIVHRGGRICISSRADEGARASSNHLDKNCRLAGWLEDHCTLVADLAENQPTQRRHVSGGLDGKT